MSDERAVRALSDVVAVERLGPGMLQVVTWSDSYVVDAREQGCNCPDKQFNLGNSAKCKHEHAAILADTGLPNPGIVTDDLDHRGAGRGAR